jgi:large subunit ribosomal protein L24
MTLRLHRNDNVVVLAGRQKGKKGKILRVDVDRGCAYVEGTNLVKRFVRKTRKNPQGGLVEKEAPLALAKLALLCTRCGKGVRTRTQVLNDGSKARLCVKCQTPLGVQE